MPKSSTRSAVGADIARQIGAAKRRDKHAVYDPQRESRVVEQALKRNKGPLSDQAVKAVFRELVSGSRALQMPLRVAYLGPEFTYSHVARAGAIRSKYRVYAGSDDWRGIRGN